VSSISAIQRVIPIKPKKNQLGSDVLVLSMVWEEVRGLWGQEAIGKGRSGSCLLVKASSSKGVIRFESMVCSLGSRLGDNP